MFSILKNQSDLLIFKICTFKSDIFVKGICLRYGSDTQISLNFSPQGIMKKALKEFFLEIVR